MRIMPLVSKLIAFIALAISSVAHSESSVGASVEDYHWQETIDNAPLSPEEYGLRYALHLKWTQDRERGLVFGYRGKFYAGKVDYDTFYQISGQPVSTTTQYSGAIHEAQLSYRAANNNLGYLGGLGLDTWQRSIGNNGSKQIEDFLIIYLRGGIIFNQLGQSPGIHGSGGLKYPIFTWEDAHLDSQGYDSNPVITPGKDISLFAELGYRINRNWNVVGYYDSWRFKQSKIVFVSKGSSVYGVYQPKSSMDAYGIKVMYSF